MERHAVPPVHTAEARHECGAVRGRAGRAGAVCTGTAERRAAARAELPPFALSLPGALAVEE